ncbi:hypothetical protein [Acinetobacter sp.]|jgi:hypothetical protein|uniref:hypothetical protein n=1 Tax=Acinetobacter sp. TaxID=472 RepID=UPI0035B49260
MHIPKAPKGLNSLDIAWITACLLFCLNQKPFDKLLLQYSPLQANARHALKHWPALAAQPDQKRAGRSTKSPLHADSLFICTLLFIYTSLICNSNNIGNRNNRRRS